MNVNTTPVPAMNRITRIKIIKNRLKNFLAFIKAASYKNARRVQNSVDTNLYILSSTKLSYY